MPETARPHRLYRVTSVLAAVVVWAALVAPDRLDLLGPVSFARIPAEGLVLAAVVLLLRPRPARLVAVLAGVALAALTLLRVLDIGFRAALERPFDPLTDVGYAGSAVGLLGDSLGRPGAAIALAAAGLVATAVLVAILLSVVRVATLVRGHRHSSTRTVAALAVVWTVSALAGLQIAPAGPVAAASTATLAGDQVSQLRDGVRDREQFAAMLARDPRAAASGPALLPGLRGKDVLIVFVESYGRVALEDPALSGPVESALAGGTAQLTAAGFSARSAYLTSPTFGGLSWLAHSTLESGLWVDSQQRYDTLVANARPTLTADFGRAGWRTVCDVPANHDDWPVATSFYRCDQVYDARNTGYAGPGFGYAPMPDQYSLDAFRRLELAPAPRAPVMAEIDLVSSHAPWAPLPRLVDPRLLGDGSVFDGMPAQGTSREAAWRSPGGVRAAYAQSIVYTLDSLVSFVTTAHDDNLVIVALGDHQPSSPVTGPGASHDVPVTVIAHDPAVLNRISGWGWSDGMRPAATAPVWPMDAFGRRFLAAYGPQPPAAPSLPVSTVTRGRAEPATRPARGHG